MTRAVELYQRYMNKQTGKFATWPLGSKVDLGDVGILHHGEFRAETTLTHLGIEFTPEKGGRTDESHSSASWSSIGAGVELNSRGPRAVAKLQFSRAGSVVFEARGLQQLRIADFRTVAKRIREHDDWQKNWVVIDQIWRSSRVAICVAVTDGAHVNVLANDGGALTSLGMLAEASLGFGFEVASGQISVVMSGSEVQPLYTCRKRNLIGKVVPASTSGDQDEDSESEWAECDFTDLVRSHMQP